MVKKITLLLLLTVNLTIFGQLLPEDEYNAFSSRSFMKFNSFLTVPTFSFLHRNNTTIEAISRSSNIQFEDASRLHLISYGGKMRDNVGAGISVFQQEINVFKDFGAIANYAYKVKMGVTTDLVFGFNFMYSRRSLDITKVKTQTDDLIANNYQDKPVVVFQPAITLVYNNFYGGIFLENLADFNLKTSELITPFAEKTFSAHLGYATEFKNLSGLLQNTTVKFLGIARRTQRNGFSYAGNILANLPKAGWIKAGYDNFFGLNAGIGINLSERLSIGFSYEKQKNLGGTNEVGLVYTFGKRRSSRRNTSSTKESNPTVNITLPTNEPTIERREEEYKDPEHNDLSDEIRIAQDSINKLNKKVDEVLELLKGKTNSPIIIRDTVRIQSETKDTSLRRSTRTPWRERTESRTGSGGVGYFVVVDQFKDIKKVKKLVAKYKRKKVTVKYALDPKSKLYYIYIDRFAKEEDADRLVNEINGGGVKGFEDDEANDLGIKVKSVSKNPVYKVKINFGDTGGESYSEPKSQPPAKVRTMRVNGVESAYYLQVSVNSKKSLADKFVDELRADNINADYFINPKTGYRHVYILKTNDREEIIRLYNNNLNNSYYDAKNIIYIK